MSLAIHLRKLQMFRDWLQHQQEYEARDQEAEMWEEFVQQWESDKALNRMAESYAAEMLIDYFSCPVCAGYCYQEGDTADCENCQIRWSVINAGEYTYLEAENFDAEGEKMVKEVRLRIDEEGTTPTWAIEKKIPILHEDEYDLAGLVNDIAENAEEYALDHNDNYRFSAENVWMSESFRDWADDELRTHGENVSFEKWSQEEFEDEPAHRHANGQLSFVQWARDEINEEHHNAEEFCAECGCSHKDAESFNAETADGNQVFNSCWKCGSGQHLYQISRYPASPDEIAGVGANPDEASTNWREGRPTQR
jgi:hypothetical protein